LSPSAQRWDKMTQDQTSEALLARAARHDAEALGELYMRFAPVLLGMLHRILPDRGAAEGVLDRVFLRVWNEASRYPSEGASVAAWLFIAARNTAVDLLRAQQKLPAFSGNQAGLVDSSFSWLPSPEAIARLDERRELLKKILNQLPQAQREALELAVFEGSTEEEIAVKLGEPLGKVKSGLRAGMRFLRYRLRAVTGTWAANI
jgi:RNA polymerase sigma-70 factor (ECF subfamily)